MKFKYTLVLLFLEGLLASLTTSSSPQSFHECQKEYDENIGELIASSGMQAASTVWNVLYDDLDLNSNSRLSASEIVMKLGTEDASLHETMSILLPQAQKWIDLAKPEEGDHELKFNGFVDAIRKSIGRVEKSKLKNEDASDVLIQLCKYFNRKIPEIVSNIQDVSNCTTFLKKDQIKIMETKPKEMIGNTWKAAFFTLDKNNNGLVSADELSQSYSQFKSASDVSVSFEISKRRLSSYLNKKTSTLSQFLASISSLLFSNSTWENMTSSTNLIGRQMFCELLRDTHREVTTWSERNLKCVKSYQQSLQRHLGGYSSIAPSYIYAFADTNKDGEVSKSELENLVRSFADKEFSAFRLLGNRSYSIQSIPLPNVILEVGNISNGDTLELSRLSTIQHKTWNAFCITATKLIQLFPSSIGELQRNASTSLLIDILRNRLQELPQNESKLLINDLKSTLNDYLQPSNSTDTTTLQSFIITSKTIHASEDITPTTQSPVSKSQLQNEATISTTVLNALSPATGQENNVLVEELQAKAYESGSYQNVISKEEQELHAVVIKYQNEAKKQHEQMKTHVTYPASDNISTKLTPEETALGKLLSIRNKAQNSAK